jgi:hypothetical protein
MTDIRIIGEATLPWPGKLICYKMVRVTSQDEFKSEYPPEGRAVLESYAEEAGEDLTYRPYEYTYSPGGPGIFVFTRRPRFSDGWISTTKRCLKPRLLLNDPYAGNVMIDVRLPSGTRIKYGTTDHHNQILLCVDRLVVGDSVWVPNKQYIDRS